MKLTIVIQHGVLPGEMAATVPALLPQIGAKVAHMRSVMDEHEVDALVDKLTDIHGNKVGTITLER